MLEAALTHVSWGSCLGDTDQELSPTREKVRRDVESLGVRASLVETAHFVDNDATCGGRWVKWA